jgi:OFA family oxalate/formate antiporter-like MFS transporter
MSTKNEPDRPSGDQVKKQGITVLVTGSIMQLFLGILYVWSVFVRPVSEVFNWHIDSVKLTSSFMLCFFVAGILAGGKLIQKMDSGKIVLGSGLLLATGMLTTAFLPEKLAWLMYVTYGILGGLGVGAGYNAIICAVQKWFPLKRGFATGVVVCAFGFSTVIFAPLIETLVMQFGLRNTFLILAAVYFITTVSLFSFIRLPDSGAPVGTPSAILLAKKQFMVTETIRTKEFYFITLSLMVATATFFILNPSFIYYAGERGVPAFGTIIVMMTGVANASGRLIIPLLSDKIGREKALLIVILVTSICALLLSFAQGFLFITSVLLVAFCFGSLPGMYSVITSDYFGIKNVGANYGAVMAGFALSALTFPMFIGLIPNETFKFITLSFMAAIGVILIIILMVTKKEKK